MTQIQDRWNFNQVTARHFTEDEFPSRMKFLRWLGRQTWIPKGQQQFLFAVMGPDKAPNYPFEVDFFGSKYRGNLSDYIDWMVFTYGSYATNELILLKRISHYLRTKRSGPLTFVDIGANSGHHTLFMAKVADHVIAFEPFQGLVKAIEARLTLNQIANVKVMPIALGAKDEILNYYLDTGPNAGVGTFLPNAKQAKALPVKLTIRKGDDVLEEQKFPRMDVVKVDVEGFEAFVFQGLQERIQADRPVILTEVSAKSRRQFGSEKAFREAFYKGAKFAEVKGRSGKGFYLEPFVYENSIEVLVTPPEYSDLMA